MSGYCSPPVGYRAARVGEQIKPGYLLLIDGEWRQGSGIYDHCPYDCKTAFANPIDSPDHKEMPTVIVDVVAAETMRCIEVIQDDPGLSTEDKLRLIADILK